MTRPSPASVFIPGGLPRATYVARDHLQIETQLRTWLDGGHTTLLSVSGVTKSGKTVLLRRFLPEALWVSGGAVENANEFWATICDELELFTEHELDASSSDSRSVDGELQLGGGPVGHLQAGGSSAGTSTRAIRRSRQQSPKNAARSALRRDLPFLILDDFHYIPADEQRMIVLGLKDLVFEGLPVIVAAVPHRAYDAVRVEKEMTGRVEALAVGNWSDDDLIDIARKGFAALEIRDSDDKIARRLATESFGSPHLMQSHCLAYTQQLLNQGRDEGMTDAEEAQWQPFFAARASATSKTAFDLLKQGPRQRTDRIGRRLKSGVETDIYGAVLAAIESTGPKTQLSYEEVRAALRGVLESDLPQRHEITNILDQLTSIARKKIDGEPVLEYDSEYSTLYIADPFFAYYLRWAPPEMKEIGVEALSQPLKRSTN